MRLADCRHACPTSPHRHRRSRPARPGPVLTQALGWKILSEREREIVIGTDENAPIGICFMPVTDPKTVKNRVHLDLASSAADRLQEINRLLALGARRADIGQTGAESWTVLIDPRETSSASCG
jgi:hypothetical protein